MCGQGSLANVWQAHWFATSGYRQTLQRIPLTRSTRTTGRCATGGQSMNVILCTPCEVVSVTPIITNVEVEEIPLNNLPARQIWSLWISTCWDTWYLCVCTSCWQWRGTSPSHFGCLSDCLQLLWHLWIDEGVHWISWTFWALIINVGHTE
jgi:hypothetical protein